MKKAILFIAAMLLIGTTAQANDQKQSDQINRDAKRYRAVQPVVFFEGGVTFYVYPNGEMDFKTLHHKKNQRVDWNNGRYNSPGHTRRYRPSTRFSIQYDYYGRLKKVGNSYINYNSFDQASRIGSVAIQYNRTGLVSKIGGLHIYYNRYNKIQYVEGNVHYNGCGYCGVTGCTTSHGAYYTNKRSHTYNRNHKYNNDKNDHIYKNRKRKYQK